MPVLQFHLVTSAYRPEAIAALIENASYFYAGALYPEMEQPPVDRVRAFVSDVSPDHWATGGVQVSRGGVPAPYFTCLSLKGRPADQLKHLMSGLTDLIARHLACEARLVRGQLIEIEPAHWFIAGSPASEARAAEITARVKG